MYFQSEYLRESVAFPRGGTFKVDLPETGLLSALLLNIQGAAVSGATLADPLWRLQDHLSTLEIIGNGSTVIKSLEFKQSQFAAWLRQGIVPPHFWRNYATNTQQEFGLLLFGRNMHDPEYGLDLSRWDNVEFRFTNASSATYHSADLSLSIKQIFLRDAPGGFRGFLKTEEWREWTTVSDETKYLTLPTDNPISGLYVRAVPPATSGVADTGGVNMMDDIELSINGGVKKIFDGGLDDLIVENFVDRGAEVITGGHFDVTADRGIDIGIMRPFGWGWGSGSKDGAVSAVIPTIEADPTTNTIKPEAREADAPIHFILRGMGFQNMAYLLHVQDLEPELLLDAGRDGEMKLDIHTRSGATYADGTNQVVLETLVTR